MKLNDVGVSGCTLTLVGNTTLRKTSPSVEYNTRLQKQSQKQKDFKTNISGISTPLILSETYGELFSFDMEYIDGKLFNETFHRISKYELDVYTNSILEYIQETKNKATDVYSTKQLQNIIVSKLESLRTYSQYQTFIDFVSEITVSTVLPEIEQSICHGDLTFSNILFSNQKLYLLDFLDSYIESYVMDIVKLRQDLKYNWYLNLLPTETHYITRIQQIFSYMLNHVEQRFPIVNSTLFDILDVVNFLRIEPYVTTKNQLSNLDRVIGETKLYEKFNSTNDGKVN